MKLKAFFSLLATLAAAGVSSLHGAGPGGEVVVVYNSRLPESKGVAEYYAQRRQVPTNQIFGFDLSTNDNMTRAEFRDVLQQPLAKALEARKLWHVAYHYVRPTNDQPARVEWKPVTSKIRYAVLCYGVPLKIDPDPNLKEDGMDKLRPEMRRNEAAVDSELALLPVLEERLPLAGPLRSPVYAATNQALLHPTNGVLLVSRLDGPTAAIARGLVDKALEAETNGLWGRAYIDLRNTTDPNYKPGDDWIRAAGEICRRLGFETVVDENPGTFPAGFPMSHIAFYIGWYDQDVSGPFAQPTVEFVPGAFAYHLQSYSAQTLRTTSQHWVGPLLAKGATITMGCVDEPYLGGTPDVAVFTARLVFQGFTYGEAACASQPVLSWQTTVVGDPLYRPFGKNPEQLQDQLQAQHSPWLAWAYLRLINVNLAIGKPVSDCVRFLEDLGATTDSSVLSEKLGDLYAALGKPSSSAHAYEQALKLDTSPQQRLRLLLTLAAKLATVQRESEAYEDYQQVLRQYPDYPDKVGLYRHLLPLALKLKKTDDAQRYEAEINRLNPPPKS